MAPQTSYSLKPAVGRAGEKADARQGDDVVGAIADGAVQCGVLGMFGDVHNEAGDLSPGEFKPLPAFTVDVDAIVESIATAAAAVVLSGADLDGVIGATKMVPARRITFVASNHANWDLSTIYINGRDVDGNPIQEALLLPDGGNTTLTTKQYFSYVESVNIPAQAGTGGAYTIGVTADDGMFAGQDCGVALREPASEPLTSSDLFADGDSINVLRKGRFFAVSEAATTKGDPVYVRMVASGADVRGQFSNAPTSGFGILKDASWATSCDQDAIGIIEKLK